MENSLKEAYNNYIDALVAYIEDCKTKKITCNADKYILDNHISKGLRDSLEIIKAGDTNKLLSKKIS